MQADISTLEALLRRVKKADGPDRELDLAIAVALVPDVLVSIHDRETGTNKPHTYWQYTASIDAAIALMQQVLPGWNWSVMSQRPRGKPMAIARIGRMIGDDVEGFDAVHDQVPLAILSALLRTLIAQSKEQAHG